MKPPKTLTPGVFHLLQPTRKEVFLWGGAAFALATLNLTPLVLISYDVLFDRSSTAAELLFMRALGVLAVWVLCETGTSFLASAIRYEIRSLLEKRVLQGLERSPDVVSFSEKRRRVLRDLATIETWFSDRLPRAFAALVVLVGSLCVWMVLDRINASLAVLLVMAWILFFALSGGREIALLRTSRQVTLRQTRLFEDVLNGARAVQSLKSIPFILRRHEVLHRVFRRKFLLRSTKWITGQLLLKMLSVASGLMVWAWMMESLDGTSLNGQFYATLWSLLFVNSAWRLKWVFKQTSQMLRSLRRVFRNLESAGTLSPAFEHPSPLADKMLWSVEFTSLQVRAAGRQSAIHQKICIERGSILMLVGPSGSGKSLLLEALCGLRTAHWKNLRVCDALDNSWEVADDNLCMPKQLFSYVETNPFLFQGTVRENLTLGNPQRLSDMSLWQHLELVGLLPAIKNLGGLNSNLPRASGIFTEDERFRLALVRAMLLERPFLALDDPFMVLDEKSWKRLVPLLDLHKEFCGIVIACRQLPTRIKADTIVHMPRAYVPAFSPAGVAAENFL